MGVGKFVDATLAFIGSASTYGLRCSKAIKLFSADDTDSGGISVMQKGS